MDKILEMTGCSLSQTRVNSAVNGETTYLFLHNENGDLLVTIEIPSAQWDLLRNGVRTAPAEVCFNAPVRDARWQERTIETVDLPPAIIGRLESIRKTKGMAAGYTQVLDWVRRHCAFPGGWYVRSLFFGGVKSAVELVRSL